jgi:radical SAM superfamily enzyme YgiQ (UPF0313 family)
MGIRYIDPLTDLGPLLLRVEKPARYSGGEYGRLCRKDAALKTAIAFPDLYEIGMSNQAMRILYNRLNHMEDISCDRSFAPAPDFEELIKSRNLPLYGLDTGISLKDLDILMFTLGYELLISGILSMLDVSGIPLRSRDRCDDDPLVIAGGPCVSNPLPYAAFIDAFWIGEAEGGFFELIQELAEMKKSGSKKTELLKRLIEHPSVWTRGKERTYRAVDSEFPLGKNGPSVFPIPSMKVVHHHGAVEIMRGCPNGCRFCHAGYWYRPMRQKNADLVEAETEAFIKTGGYREITLSSLSSGDYQYLDDLIESLNRKFRKQHISFQLPSLRVSSFSLKLLDKISEIRKSGLTFAVETPLEFWQMAINKQVSVEDIVSILKEARKAGWRGAKFYFMLGLPLNSASDNSPETQTKSEEEEIVDFIERIAKLTGMHFNINIGTFVPKPHTPFQRAKQMAREDAEGKFNFLKVRLKSQGHKVGIQDPLVSVIEGIASRGDERVGAIFEEAYLKGSRLDSWTEYIKRDVWEELLQRNKTLIGEILGERDINQQLPWSCVSSGTAEKYFEREFNKSLSGENTLPCMKNCNNPCGACGSSTKLVQNVIQGKVNSSVGNDDNDNKLSQKIAKHADPDTFKIIFSFTKQGSAVFQSHLGLLEIFSMSFTRADIPVLYSQGFNPLPRLEIASPISLGLKARGEVAALDTEFYFEADKFRVELNAFFPDGLEIVEAMNVHIPAGEKKHSLSSLLWGYVYAGKDGSPEIVRKTEEKSYRETRTGSEGCEGNLYSLERLSVLAKADAKNADAPGASYFDVFRKLYPE